MSEESKEKKVAIWVTKEIYNEVAAYGTAKETMMIALRRILDIAKEKRE